MYNWINAVEQIEIDQMNRPFRIGQSCPTRVIPPDPRYCPIATSWKKIGIPQKIIAVK